MLAPKVRVAKLHDPADMRGLAYVPHLFVLTLDAPLVAGYTVLAEWDEAIMIKRADLWVTEAFVGGMTCEIGVDTNQDALIDTADYDEAVLNAWATNVGSSNANFPNGMFLPAGDQLRATWDGTGTLGEICLVLELYRMAIFNATPNYAFVPGDAVAS